MTPGGDQTLKDPVSFINTGPPRELSRSKSQHWIAAGKKTSWTTGEPERERVRGE